jgi:UDP:flavonoid glycosyltransferase YjiC (YdhE family)
MPGAETLGAGLALPIDAGVSTIGQAIAEVLQTHSYREAARRLQGTFASAPGAAGGADELERELCHHPVGGTTDDT